jgi:hypothetical protein
VDTFVLSILSRPRTIGEDDYLVAWNAEISKATILVVTSSGELHDLIDSNGEAMTFSCELEAHRYLNGLWMETYPEKIGDTSWKDL